MVDPEEVRTDVDQSVSEVEMLHRAYWQTKSLIYMMRKKTDYVYDKKVRSVLDSYADMLQAKLIARGIDVKYYGEDLD